MPRLTNITEFEALPEGKQPKTYVLELIDTIESKVKTDEKTVTVKDLANAVQAFYSVMLAVAAEKVQAVLDRLNADFVQTFISSADQQLPVAGSPNSKAPRQAYQRQIAKIEACKAQFHRHLSIQSDPAAAASSTAADAADGAASSSSSSSPSSSPSRKRAGRGGVAGAVAPPASMTTTVNPFADDDDVATPPPPQLVAAIKFAIKGILGASSVNQYHIQSLIGSLEKLVTQSKDTQDWTDVFSEASNIFWLAYLVKEHQPKQYAAFIEHAETVGLLTRANLLKQSVMAIAESYTTEEFANDVAFNVLYELLQQKQANEFNFADSDKASLGKTKFDELVTWIDSDEVTADAASKELVRAELNNVVTVQAAPTSAPGEPAAGPVAPQSGGALVVDLAIAQRQRDSVKAINGDDVLSPHREVDVASATGSEAVAGGLEEQENRQALFDAIASEVTKYQEGKSNSNEYGVSHVGRNTKLGALKSRLATWFEIDAKTLDSKACKTEDQYNEYIDRPSLINPLQGFSVGAELSDAVLALVKADKDNVGGVATNRNQSAYPNLYDQFGDLTVANLSSYQITAEDLTAAREDAKESLKALFSDEAGKQLVETMDVRRNPRFDKVRSLFGRKLSTHPTHTRDRIENAIATAITWAGNNPGKNPHRGSQSIMDELRAILPVEGQPLKVDVLGRVPPQI